MGNALQRCQSPSVEPVGGVCYLDVGDGTVSTLIKPFVTNPRVDP